MKVKPEIFLTYFADGSNFGSIFFAYFDTLEARLDFPEGVRSRAGHKECLENLTRWAMEKYGSDL